MSRVTAVLFDLDDTLFDHRGAVGAAIAAYRSIRYGAGDPDADARRWHELEELHYHRYLAGELDFRGQRRERARACGADHGDLLDDAAADAWWDEYHAHYRSGWRLHDDALRCLDALAERRLGIITNGDPDAQSVKIRAVALAERFPMILTSGELGIRKPDPRIFHEACRRPGVRPTAAAYVGDRLRTDALGAVGAGLRGVWLDRPGAATDADRAEAAASDVPIIRTLDALPALLA